MVALPTNERHLRRLIASDTMTDWIEDIKAWCRTKGYEHDAMSLIDLLNEIDYQARECGAAAERVRTAATDALGCNHYGMGGYCFRCGATIPS